MSEKLLSHFYYFLETFIHSILYSRSIYPQNIFEKKKYFNIIVPQSRHPEINDYIKKVLKNSENLLKTNQLKNFLILIEDGNRNIIEDYVIKVEFLEGFSRREAEEDETVFKELEEEYQSILLKTAMLDVQLKPLPEGNNNINRIFFS